MRRGGIVLVALALLATACSKSEPTGKITTKSPMATPPGPTRIVAGSASIGTISTGPGGPGGVAVSLPAIPQPDGPTITADTELRLKRDAIVAEAMELLADRQWAEALAKFEEAEQILSTPITGQAIERLRQRLELEAAAEQTAADIRVVLEEGRAEEASRLAALALQHFATTDAVDKIAALKRQADALVAVAVTDRSARFNRFRREYDEATRDGNKRAALVALEQALQAGEDKTLQARYDELAAEISRYDQLRTRAQELRRDSTRLEEAIATLREAAKIWDNAALRQEIEEYEAAWTNRRDRLSVADFEIRGDIGIPQAGAFLADELLPAFKARYDLVERGQLNKVIEELKLQDDLADDEAGRRELGQVAELDFLVVGSVTPVAGLTVQARLINVKTGLVVQTARLSAPTAEELTKQLPQLARDLMMTDMEKAAQQPPADLPEVEVLKPRDVMELPPPPEPPLDEIPLPAPIIPARVKAPRIPDQDREQFVRRFDQMPPPPPPGQVPLLPALPAQRDLELRQRSLLVALELGDNLFRRGRFREAFQHYEFALNLFPGHRAVRMRVERCRPLLPPMPPPVNVRPRIAILDFVTLGDPNAVPPWLSEWAPERLGAYMPPDFHVVDRTELYWWMGRLGITPEQIVTDPVARLYLGRALRIRYFMVGNIAQSNGLRVATYLIDAEFGFLASAARIFVRNFSEVPLRLPELAWLIKMSPEQRRAAENDDAQWALLQHDLRSAQRAGNWSLVIEIGTKGLRLRPNNVLLLEFIRDAQVRLREMQMRQARIEEVDRLRHLMEQQQRQRLELVRQAEEARLRAAAQAQIERERLEAQRRAAALDMARRAQVLVQTKRFTLAIQLFESACALRPNDESLYRELALARAKAEETARAEAAEAAARREAEKRRQREAELAKVRTQLEAERQKQAKENLARQRWREERDRREYERLMDLAQQHSARKQYEQAVAAAQQAKQLRPTPEAERLVTQLLIEVARVNAEKRGAAEKAELERQLAAERNARAAAEAEAARNRQKYEELLAKGQQFLKAEKYDDAEELFLQASKIHRTDFVLAQLNQARVSKQRLQARLKAERDKQEELRRQNELLKQKLAEAKSALAAHRTEQALALYREAKKIAPTDVDVLAGLARAEQLREQELAKARREGEEKARRETFQRLLASGKANLAARKYEAAVLALSEAVKLDPRNAEAKAALAEAESKVNADAQAREQMAARRKEYENHMRDGRRYMTLKQYEKALTSFESARKINPGDQAATDFIAEAKEAMAAALKAKQMAAKNTADMVNALSRFRTALVANKLDEAQKAYAEAARIDAKHRDVVQALSELRKAQEAEQAKMRAEKQREEQFATQVTRARAAFQSKKWDEAAKAIDAALRIKPTDAGAKQLQAQIAKARGEATAMERQDRIKQLVTQARAAITAKKFDEADKLLDQAEALAPRDTTIAAARAELKRSRDAMAAADAEARRNQQTYATAMKAARDQLRAKRFDEAARSVATALRAMPQDKEALALQKQIEEAKKAATTPMPPKPMPPTPPKPMPPMGKPPAYTQMMQQGANQEKAGRYALALSAYQAALRAVPNDADAKKKVDFCQFMVVAEQAMSQKKFADARTAYENALKLFPTDANARAGLQRAKTMK